MIKTRFILALIFIMAHGTLIAQVSQGRGLKISAGYIRFEKDNLNGFFFSNEYNLPLSGFITLSPSLDFAHATTGDEYPYSLFNKTSISGNLLVNLTPFKSPISERKWALNLGVGPSIRYFSGPSISNYKVYENATIIIGEHLDYSVPLFHPNDRLKSHNFLRLGGKVGLDAGVHITSRTSAGIGISFSKYGSGESVFMSGISFYYDL
jgi:hypothetical protein